MVLIRTSPAFGSGFGISACSKTSTGSPKLRWIILRMLYSSIGFKSCWVVSKARYKCALSCDSFVSKAAPNHN